MDDPLKDFDLRRLPELEAALMEHWPRSILILRWISTRLRWQSKEPNLHPFGITCPEGDYNNGLVLFGRTGGRFVYMTVFNFNDRAHKLKNALLTTKRIDWDDKPVCGIPEELVFWFKDILDILNLEPVIDDPTDYLWLPMEKALKFSNEIPEDAYLSRLRPEDMSTVNSVWPHRFDGSLQFLTEIARLNYGMGLYCKASNELMSWGLNYEYGDIGVLQTKREHARRGYASTIVKALSLQMAEDNEHPYAFYVKHNTASKRLLEKLGFEFAGCYNWIVFK